MRRIILSTTTAFGIGAAARLASSSATVAAATPPRVWDDLPSDSLALFAERAFGVTEAKNGIAFTELLGLDEELLAMVPGECVGVILCHPVDARIAALKARQAANGDRGETPSTFFTVRSLGAASGSACGPCAVANVLANAPAASTSSTAKAAVLATLEPSTSSAAADAATVSASASDKLFAANQSTASSSSTASATANSGKYHYTAFVPAADGTVVELDSLHANPTVWASASPAAAAAALNPRGPAGAPSSFLFGAASVLRQYFDAANDRIDFAAVAVSHTGKQ